MAPKINIALEEGVILPLPIAGLGSRALAAIADSLTQGLLLGLGLALLLPLILSPSPEGHKAQQETIALLARGGLTLWIFAVVWGYHVLFEALWAGRTPGKRLFNLRVIGPSGLPPTLQESALRNIIRPIDLAPLFYGLGGLVAFLSPLGQRLGDMAAGTVVLQSLPIGESAAEADVRFARPREQRWRALGDLLQEDLQRLPPQAVKQTAALYRGVTQDMAVASASKTTPQLQNRLGQLISEARQGLFRPDSEGLIQGIVAFFAQRLPQTMRRQGTFITAAALLLLMPLGVTWSIARQAPSRTYSMATPEQRAVARAHQGTIAEERDGGLSASASAFYMTHNASVSLRAFAGGMAFGLGTAWALVSNGYSLGVTLALVEMMDAEEALLTFVASHLPWEILAIILAGAGGLILGASLLRPGQLTRSASLARGAKDALTLALGSIGLLMVAGIIEGSISPSSLDATVKYSLGAMGALFLIVYGLFAGRDQPASSLTPRPTR